MRGIVGAVSSRPMEAQAPLQLVDGAATLDVWVIPGASRTEIKGIHNGALRIRLAAPAAGGQANRALTKFLARVIGADVALLRGLGSRRKKVRIDNADLAAIAARLGIEIL